MSNFLNHCQESYVSAINKNLETDVLFSNDTGKLGKKKFQVLVRTLYH